MQVGKQYPYVIPTIEMKDIKGLSKEEQAELKKQLDDRAHELSKSGSVMMIELVQVVEDFLNVHNCDPNMSAWEQMKAREALEKEEETKVQTQSEEELSRLMNDGSANEYRVLSPLTSKTKPYFGREGHLDADPNFGGADLTEVEREMLRQRDALEAARRFRMGEVDIKRSSSLLGDEEDESDDDGMDYQADYEAALGLAAGASRYQTDFIEMGVLGRGGGGEVVKVRNRLDRRTYAVKKIILEPELGKLAKYGAIQNQKLRREVTTISRMTHKNIVRYYQAWVEGGIETIEEAAALDETNEEASSAGDRSAADEDASDDSEDDSDTGWWTNSPTDHLPSEMARKLGITREESSEVDGEEMQSGSFGEEDDDDGSDGTDTSEPFHSKVPRNLHSESMLSLLEHENDQGFHSPLLVGIGFQDDQMYSGLFDKKESRSKDLATQSEEDLLWDESSVKVDSSSRSNSILYIQMEYCSTTLRKLIDDKGMANIEENEAWRMIRQTLEALVYIHGRGIIHRE